MPNTLSVVQSLDFAMTAAQAARALRRAAGKARRRQSCQKWDRPEAEILNAPPPSPCPLARQHPLARLVGRLLRRFEPVEGGVDPSLEALGGSPESAQVAAQEGAVDPHLQGYALLGDAQAGKAGLDMDAVHVGRVYGWHPCVNPRGDRYIDGMLGVRLAESRKRAGWSQHQLAIELGERYDQSVISAVENKRSSLRLTGAVKAAQVLDVSLDYLAGLTDNPTPVDDRAREAEARVHREEARKREQLEAALERSEAELQSRGDELERLRAQVAAEPWPRVPLEVVLGGLSDDEAREHPTLRLVPELDVEAAAGTEAYVEQEPIVGHLAFREEWLARTCVNPEQCRSIRVRGRSMEPTLQAGARILVDPQRTRRLRDRIFVVATEDGVLVKRLARDGDDWILFSDNEDYPPIPWPEGAEVRGQVMWTGKNL